MRDLQASSVCHHQVLVSHQVGGAGLVALQLAQHVRDQGQTSQVWIPGKGPAHDEALRRSLTIQDFDSRRLFSQSRLMAATSNWRMSRRLRSFGPGIAHLHGPFFYRALRLGLRWARLKTVVHVQIEEDEVGLHWAFQDPPDVIITCARFLTGYVRRTLPERFRDSQKIVAIPNAVDIDRFQPGDRVAAKQRVGAPRQMPLALMLANLSPHKGQETAIRATAQLKARGVNVALWLAGTEREASGAYTRKLDEMIRQFNVEDRVKLLGQRNDAPELLQSADVFLLPSTAEGLPLSLLEAQASKVPVVATATAGVPEVVLDGVTGFLVPQSDPEGYAARIESLVSNSELRMRMADAAFQQVIRDYNWSSYLRRVTEVYRELSPLKSTKYPQRLAGAMKS